MEINPNASRLRMLQQIDGVQMQREATPDEETAGCPGCPYFWTCPVPHRGEEVAAPQEIEPTDVEGVLGPRRDYHPRDESDVGWTDEWVDEDGLPIAHDTTGADGAEDHRETDEPGASEVPEVSDPEAVAAPNPSPADRGRRARRWGLFRRRG